MKTLVVASLFVVCLSVVHGNVLVPIDTDSETARLKAFDEKIQYLKTLNLLVGYPDGGFGHRNDRPASRYELAVAFYASYSIGKNIVSTYPKALQLIREAEPDTETAEDLRQLLRTDLNYLLQAMTILFECADEFKKELIEIGVDHDQMKNDMNIWRYRVRNIRIPEVGEGLRPFVDVPSDHWAAEAANALKREGILVGYPGCSFGE